MANIIKPKRSNTAAKVPNTTELTSGELGVNMADRKVYINNGTAVVQVGAGNLNGLGDVAIATPANGQALTYNSTTSKWENTTPAGSGTVTSVGITAGTGVTVSNSPITTSGNIAVGLSTKLTAIENLSGAGFITQNGSGAIAGRTLQAGTGISIQHGNGSSQDPVITNSAPDQTVALTGAGATTISGTYPNFTITSVNTTYGAATSTVPGLIELGSDTAQTVAANAVSTTASRSYALQVNAAGQGVVNVPWTDTNSGGTVTSVGLSLPGQFTVSGSPVTTSGTLTAAWASQTANTVLAAPNGAAGVPAFRAIVAADIPTLNQNTTGTAANVTGTVAVANGGTGATTAATARTNLGATTLGGNLYTLANVAAIAFPRFNADNTVSTLDAATFRTAIGAGTGSGTVTSVATSGTVSGLTLTGGTITTTGTITLGGTLAVTPSNFASQTANTFLAAPNGAAGAPTFRAMVAADVPTLNQNTTGTSANVTGTVAVANGGTGATTTAAARTNLGATTLGGNLFTVANVAAVAFPRFNANNTVSSLDAATFRTAIGAGTSSTTGTVTSVSGTGTASGLSLSGTVTTSGSLTLSGTVNSLAAGTYGVNISGTATNVTGTVAVSNGGTGLTSIAARSIPVANSANTYTTVTPAAGQSVRVNAGNTAWEAYTPGTGTVTGVGGTGTVSGISLSGNVTTSGNLTLGGTLAVTPSNFASQTAKTFLAAPNGAAGVPTFRALVASDVPTLNQNTTGTAANVTGTVAVANGGTGSTTAAGALTNLGAYAATNPSGYITTAGARSAVSFTAGSGAYNSTTGVFTIPTNTNQLTNGAGFVTSSGVTSVSGTGTVSGLTLTGTVTSTGSLTLGGNLSITADMIYNSFTATAAQTTFTTTNTYTSGKIEVFVNGVKMVNGSDVTVTSGTSVVMASGLPVGTRVDLVYPI